MNSCDSICIKKNFVILCEGKDAYYFLIYMLQSHEFSAESIFSNDIQVEDFGGINELQNYLKVLRSVDGFEKIKNLLIIRDAENNFDNAVTQITTNIRNAGFVAPTTPGEWAAGNPAVGFLLFPLCSKSKCNGTLENLCLKTFSIDNKDGYDNAVNTFLDQTEELGALPRKFKNQLHAYFSATDKYVGLKIGEAARVGAFNWRSQEFDFLREFILDSFNRTVEQ